MKLVLNAMQFVVEHWSLNFEPIKIWTGRGFGSIVVLSSEVKIQRHTLELFLVSRTVKSNSVTVISNGHKDSNDVLRDW